MTDSFIGLAKTQTMRRDFERLRRAIRKWDAEETEKAWDMCERWVNQLEPEAHSYLRRDDGSNTTTG